MPLRKPPLSIPLTLARYDLFHERSQDWPTVRSWPLPEMLGEKWWRIDNALRYGLRGLDGGSALARLLEKERSVRSVGNLREPTKEQIAGWAKQHREQTSEWPNGHSGPVLGVPGEVWRNIDMALCDGNRGLPRG